MSATHIVPAPAPLVIAGVTLAQWAFVVRIWLAMVIALATAFWLQLDSASTAAVTIAILAQPQRGQAFRKALFFFAATCIGVAASFVITAIFTQSRDLFVIVYAAWLALTVYVAAFYDGTRSYGAVLSGYTVAIIAVRQIDAPQDVFTAGTARLAAISIGIASVVLVNDVLASPTVYPGVRDRLRSAHRRMRTLVAAHVRGEALAPDEVVALLGAITATRLDIQAVASEGPDGRERSAAAASAATAMIDALATARGFAIMTAGLPDDAVARLRGWVEGDDKAAAEAALADAMIAPDRTPERVMRLAVTAGLIDCLRLAGDELDAMEAGRPAQRHVSLPIHRDRELARLAAFRVFLVVLVTAAIMILSGWSKTSSCLLFVSVLGALSSTMPSPRFFAKSAMIAIPFAAILAGIVEFVILDGSDAFPLLAIGLAPVVILACLLMQNPKTASIGSLTLTFTLVVLSPANPQSYNAESYITSATLVTTAALLFGGLLSAFFPVTEKDRRRWMVGRIRTDLREAMDGRPRHCPGDMAYLTADRIVALARFQVGCTAARRWRLAYTLLLFSLTKVVGHGQRRLDRLPAGTVPPEHEAKARAAFATLDVSALDEAATALLANVQDVPADQRRRLAGLIADLGIAARITEAHASELRHLRRAVAA